MFDAYKRFFRFSGTEKSTWYKGMAFELLRSIFEALQFVALLIVLRALVEQNITGATAWTALGIMVVSVAGAALCWYLAHNSEGHANYRMCGEKRIHIGERMKYMPMGYFNAQSLGESYCGSNLHNVRFGEYVFRSDCPDSCGYDSYCGFFSGDHVLRLENRSCVLCWDAAVPLGQFSTA